jgi:hypothetical protein
MKEGYLVDNLTVIEYKAVRVLTTEQLAQVYGCEGRRISENFNRNRERFMEGQHYFKLESGELKGFKHEYANCVFANLNSLYLWTRRGASRHCKMLGTDQAWDMFDQLEENYFTPKALPTMSHLEVLQGTINQLVEQDHRIHRLELENEKRDEKMDVLDSRLDTLNGVCTTGDKQQKLNSMVRLYAVKAGLQYSEAWRHFRQAYNLAYHTNVNLSKKRYAEKNNIKNLSLPAYLTQAGYIDDALLVADKLLRGVAA